MRRLILGAVLVGLGTLPAAADSLWGGAGGGGSLYGQGGRTFDLGDIVTIQLVENTSASNKADLDTQKESNKSLRFSGINNIDLPLGLGDIGRLFGTALSTNPTFRLDAVSDFEGEAASNRSAKVTGVVSAQVVEVLPNGVLKVEATQTVYINEEQNVIVLTGLIRPEDVDAANQVPSTRIANAEIFYTGRGPLTNTNRRGILTELWEFIWPF